VRCEETQFAVAASLRQMRKKCARPILYSVITVAQGSSADSLSVGFYRCATLPTALHFWLVAATANLVASLLLSSDEMRSVEMIEVRRGEILWYERSFRRENKPCRCELMASVGRPLAVSELSRLLQVQVVTGHCPLTDQAHNDHSPATIHSFNQWINQSTLNQSVSQPASQ